MRFYSKDGSIHETAVTAIATDIKNEIMEKLNISSRQIRKIYEDMDEDDEVIHK